MAEVGIASGIAGLLAFGAKLAMSLYEVTDTVASARGEISSIGRDISLFCAVLKRVPDALDKPQAARFSTTALLTISEVTDRCLEIFTEIDGILKKSKSGGDGDSESSIKVVGRVKWAFRRPRVLLLLGTLNSMKITLLLMLQTLEFSEKVYSRTNSAETQNEIPAEEMEAHNLAETLLLAHQVSLEDLHELEENCRDNTDLGSDSPKDEYANMQSKQKGASGKDSRHTHLRKRASIWLSEVSSEYIPSDNGSILSKVSLVSESREQTLTLAGRWTTSRCDPNRTPKHSRGSDMISPLSPDRTTVNTGNQKQTVASNFVPKNKYPHAFERWETLSSHWEGITSYWVRRLEQNTDDLRDQPILEKLSKQVVDLSAAGTNLFYAVVELQRLRASSERKFQRWFYEQRQEQESQREVIATLEDTIAKEKEAEKKQEPVVAELADSLTKEQEAHARSRDELQSMQEQLRLERQQRLNVVQYLTGSSTSNISLSSEEQQ